MTSQQRLLTGNALLLRLESHFMRSSATPLTLLALALGVLMMRGPVTGIGAIAEPLSEALGMGYVAYGFVSALPIVCFGLCCAAVPVAAQKLGMARLITLCFALILAGSALRLVFNLPLFSLATVLIGVGIAFLNALMPVVLRHLFKSDVAFIMGVFTGLIGFSGSIGAYCSVPVMQYFESVRAPLALWVIWSAVTIVLWTVSRKPDNVKIMPLALDCSLLARPMTWAVSFVMSMQSLTIYTTVAWVPTLLADQGMSASDAGLASAIFLLVSAPASILTSRFIRLCGSERVAAFIMTAIFVAGIGLWAFVWSWGGSLAYLGCVLAGIPQGITFSMAMILMAKKSSDLNQLLLISSLAQGIGYLIAGLGPFICGLLYNPANPWPILSFMLAAVCLWGTSALYAFGNQPLFVKKSS